MLCRTVMPAKLKRFFLERSLSLVSYHEQRRAYLKMLNGSFFKCISSWSLRLSSSTIVLVSFEREKKTILRLLLLLSSQMIFEVEEFIVIDTNILLFICPCTILSNAWEKKNEDECRTEDKIISIFSSSFSPIFIVYHPSSTLLTSSRDGLLAKQQTPPHIVSGACCYRLRMFICMIVHVTLLDLSMHVHVKQCCINRSYSPEASLGS